MILPVGKPDNVVGFSQEAVELLKTAITKIMAIPSNSDANVIDFKTLKQLEIEHIKLALAKYSSKAEAARKLGLSQKSFYSKLHRYGLYAQYEDPTLRGKHKRIGK